MLGTAEELETNADVRPANVGLVQRRLHALGTRAVGFGRGRSRYPVGLAKASSAACNHQVHDEHGFFERLKDLPRALRINNEGAKSGGRIRIADRSRMILFAPL